VTVHKFTEMGGEFSSGAFSAQTAAGNAVRAKERFPQERMEKFLAEMKARKVDPGVKA